MKTYGHITAAGGTILFLAMSPVIGGLSLLGAVVIGTTWFVCNVSESQHEREQMERRKRKMNSTLPVPIGTVNPYYGSTWQPPTYPSIRPEVILAEASPRLAASVLERLSLDRTHEAIVTPVAVEFARQSRGFRAITRRTGGFFSGDGTETIVIPL